MYTTVKKFIRSIKFIWKGDPSLLFDFIDMFDYFSCVGEYRYPLYI